MRRLLRWALRLALVLLIVAVACVATAVLMRDKIIRNILVNRLQAATGMKVQIDALHIGIRSPTFAINGLRCYNTADFGGALCLDIPELHIEYDRPALRVHQLHFTLLRVNVAEFSMISDKKGRKNFSSPQQLRAEIARPKSQSNHWKFTGIDVMDTTLGKLRVADFATGNSEDIDLSVKNQILRNVKTWSDLAPLGLTTLAQGNASSNNHEIGLGQILDSVLKAP